MRESEQEELLQKTYELAEENNTMLRKMRRSRLIFGTLKLIIWIALIAGGVWGYMEFVQPMFQQMVNAYQEVQEAGAEGVEQLKGLSEFPPAIKSFFENMISGEQKIE